MSARCGYCGMPVNRGGLKASFGGERMAFCSQRCVVMFRALGPRGRARARVQAERTNILEAMEAKRGSRVLTLVHRREPWLRGSRRSITIEDSEAIVAQLRRAPPRQPVDLILHTPGGLVLAAEMIAMAVRKRPAKVTAIVPFYAMSGGSLIALAAKELMMEKESILGPLDPQVAGFPAHALVALPSLKPAAAVSDQMLILSGIARQSVDQIREFVKWILEDKLAPKDCDAVAAFLTGGYLTHDTPIVPEVLHDLGLPVKEGVPEDVYDLFRTYEFGSCARPDHGGV